MKRCLYIVCFLGVLLFSVVAGGRTRQRVAPPKTLYGNNLDTLSFGERFSLRTNAVDWVALTPNVGLEFTLGNMNWSRWTLGLSGRYKPDVNNDRLAYHAFNFQDVRLELRRYMHGKGERTSFFTGVYGVYGHHDVKLSGAGYRGNHGAAGLTAGLVVPLYGYQNHSSLDFEFALSAGVMLARHDTYQKVDGSLVTTVPADKFALKFSPVLLYAMANNMLRVSLVYHFGHSVNNRDKRRIAVDERYRLHLNEVQLRNDSTRQARLELKETRRDSLDRVDYERRFEKQRLALERAFISDSLRQVKQAIKDTLKQKKKDE